MRVVVVLGVSSSEAAVGRGFVHVGICLDVICLVHVSMIALAVYILKYILKIAVLAVFGAPCSPSAGHRFRA